MIDTVELNPVVFEKCLQLVVSVLGLSLSCLGPAKADDGLISVGDHVVNQETLVKPENVRMERIESQCVCLCVCV